MKTQFEEDRGGGTRGCENVGGKFRHVMGGALMDEEPGSGDGEDSQDNRPGHFSDDEDRGEEDSRESQGGRPRGER